MSRQQPRQQQASNPSSFRRPAPAVSAAPAAVERLERRRLMAATPPPIVQFSPPTGAFPDYITANPDGNVYFGETLGNAIYKMTPSGQFTKFDAPNDVRGITTGSDKNLWVASEFGSALDRFTTAGVETTFKIPGSFNDPLNVTLGPDGNVWYSEAIFGKVGKVTPAGVATVYQPPSKSGVSSPGPITAGPDGALWFADKGGIGRVTTGGAFTQFALPQQNGAAADPSAITLGPDRNLWFVEKTGNVVGRITPGGAVTIYNVPTAKSSPTGITAGPDGALWFTENVGTVGRITTSGQITEYPVSGASDLSAITRGADGNLYFLEAFPNKVGEIVLNGKVPVPTFGVPPGKLPNGSLYGSVFNDLNANATPDVGETGLSGIQVYVDVNHDGTYTAGTDVAVTTDANGNFTFSNLSLKLGIYSVRVVAPGASKANTRLGGDHWDVVIGPNQIPSTIGLVFGLSNFGG